MIYMGLANLPRICRSLIAAGLPADTPAAAVASGTLPDERLCRSTLARLPEDAARSGLKAPVLIVIGKVVALSALLGNQAWQGEEAAIPARDLSHG